MPESRLLAAVANAKADDRGSFAVSFAFLSVPMLFLVGMTVDYTEKSMTEARIQSIVDSLNGLIQAQRDLVGSLEKDKPFAPD